MLFLKKQLQNFIIKIIVFFQLSAFSTKYYEINDLNKIKTNN